jgi:hypothetical protein
MEKKQELTIRLEARCAKLTACRLKLEAEILAAKQHKAETASAMGKIECEWKMLRDMSLKFEHGKKQRSKRDETELPKQKDLAAMRAELSRLTAETEKFKEHEAARIRDEARKELLSEQEKERQSKREKAQKTREMRRNAGRGG